MAANTSQPPATPERNPLGNAANNPAIFRALQEELGNNTVGGVMAQRLAKAEQELAELKETFSNELMDIRIIMSQHNTGIHELAVKMEKVSLGQNMDVPDDEQKSSVQIVAAGKHDVQIKAGVLDRGESVLEKGTNNGPSNSKRISWNQMSSGNGVTTDGLTANQMAMGSVTGVFQDGSATDDLTVDRWGFKQSCWDAAAFLGDTDIVLPAEAAANTFLLLLNIGIQTCFVIIVFKSLTSSTVDEDAQWGYHMWRSNTGHTVMYMDKNTQESLASRVCRNDRSLYLSDTQTQQVNAIDEYLYDNAPFNGPLMALLAIYVWTLTVSKEFHVLKDMFVALSHLPRGKTTIVSEKNRLKLESLRLRRSVFITVLIVARSAIAASILYSGVMFLAVTISLEDILLNAIALEFILNVDELLYQAMAPMKTRRFLLLLKPLPLRKSPAWKGLDSNIFVWLVLSFGFATFVLFYFLLPEMDNMKKAKDELCAGYLTFSYSPTVMGYAAWSDGGSGSKVTVDEAEQRLPHLERYKVIRGVIENGMNPSTMNVTDPRANGHYYPFLAGPGWSIANMDTWDVKTFAEKLNGACQDVLDSASYSQHIVAIGSVTEALYVAGDTTSKLECQDLKKYCQALFPPGIQVRAYCPVTCGCRDPGSPLALPFGAMGCPSTCRTHKEYLTLLAKQECIQKSPAELMNTSGWVNLGLNWRIAVRGWSPSGTGATTQLAWRVVDLMDTIGCNAVPVVQAMGVDMCEPPDLKPLRFHCPEACGCKLHLSELCPTKCAAGGGDAAIEDAPTATVEYTWTAVGIAYVTDDGTAGMLGNPKAGDTVTETQKTMMLAAGGIEAAATSGLVDIVPGTGPSAVPKTIEYMWTDVGITYVTDQGLAGMLGNPKAGDTVTETQTTMMLAAGGIEAAATSGLVKEIP